MNRRPVAPVALAATAALLLAATPARAQEGAGTVYPKERYPVQRLVDQPLTLSQGLLRLDVPVVINLSEDRVGEPISIPAAVSYGLTSDLEVGIFHATGICLTGEDNGCPEVYDDIGGRARLSVFRDPGGQLVLDGAVLASDFDSTNWDAAVGLGYKRTLEMAAVIVRADLGIALSDRDLRLFKELLALSVEGQYQLATGFAVFGRVGVDIPIEEASGVDAGIAAPVAIGAEFAPLRQAAIGAELQFPNLIGEDATADLRQGTVYLRLFL